MELWQSGAAPRAIAGVSAVTKVMQAVNDAAFPVEEVGDCVEELVIALFKFPPQCVRNQIGVLNEARGPGINKERYINQVMQRSPPIAERSESGR